MQRESVLVGAAGFAAGVVLTLPVLIVSGGFYEHRLFGNGESQTWLRAINEEGWEIVPHVGDHPHYVRRPRVRLF
jgi:hypothetical protein